MRATHATPSVERQRPTRWSDIGILVAIAPTLATITLVASYYFGVR